jgi:predicted MFS family arabinose efflux permease
MRGAFLIAALTVLAIAAGFRFGLVEPHPDPGTSASEATFRSLFDALKEALRGDLPGMRAIFATSLLLQLTFQTFTTWYALHAIARFGVRPEDVTVGFIAWAMGGVIGALPAGWIGTKFGRRNAMLLGFFIMAVALVALDRVTSVTQATPLLALASAAWTFPTVNAYPMFVEPIPPARRGVLASMFLLCMALGGGIGDPMNGALFDLFGYRPLFLLMAAYTALAFVAVLGIPRGVGEADVRTA